VPCLGPVTDGKDASGGRLFRDVGVWVSDYVIGRQVIRLTVTWVKGVKNMRDKHRRVSGADSIS